jgi:hypothetical protein
VDVMGWSGMFRYFKILLKKGQMRSAKIPEWENGNPKAGATLY